MDQPLDLKGVYHLCHLALVNIPYLGVRIYLWSGFGSDISLFIMKNVIGILFHLKDVVPDFVLLHRQCLAIRRSRQPAVRANSLAREDALELHWHPIILWLLFWFKSNSISQPSFSRGHHRTRLDGHRFAMLFSRSFLILLFLKMTRETPFIPLNLKCYCAFSFSSFFLFGNAVPIQWRTT